MKISKKTEYGLGAMVFLAKNLIRKGGKGKIGRPFSLREIATETKMPFGFLERIFSKLEKAGLVKAKLGANGGYFLTRPASRITVSDIVSVLEEDLAVVRCSNCSMAGGCVSRDVWDRVSQSLYETLESITLASLIK